MDADRREYSRPFLGWRMVAIAFLSYNCAMGLTSGSFGTLLPTLQNDLHTSRAAASSAYGFMLLSTGLLSPVVGNLTRFFRLRTLMITGAAFNALGFLLLAYADNLTEVLLIYGGVVGSAGCLMGVIPSPTLVGRWFEQGTRGKALGLTMMPMFIFIAPPIAAFMIEHGGRHLLFLFMAAVFAAVIPVLTMVVEQPADVGQTSLRPVAAAEHGRKPEVILPIKSTFEIFTDTRFWLISIAIGILTASGIAFVAQGVGIAIETGAGLTAASTVLSAYGAGTLAGALVYGWLMDRLGPFLTLIICMSVDVAAWFAFTGISSLPPMQLLAGLIGAAAGATVALHSAVMPEIFGTNNFSRAIGYSYLIKVPFLFGAAPLSGYLYDRSHNYASTFLFFACALCVATAVSVLLAFDQRRRYRPA